MRLSPVYIFIFAWAGLCFAQDSLPPVSAWRVSHRFQAGWEMDSNVYEALTAPQPGQDLRLLYELKLRRQINKSVLHSAYRGGCQWYPGLPRENKLIQEVEVAGQKALSSGLMLGVEGWGRLKLFLQREEDYAIGRGQLFLLAHLPYSISLKAGVGCEGLQYANTEFYTYSAPGLHFQLQRPLGPHLALVALVNRMKLHYRRNAIRSISMDEEILVTDGPQEDSFTAWGLRLEASWPAFIGRVGCRRETNHSNAVGYDFTRHVFEAFFVKQIASWYVRGMVTLQQKEYSSDLHPLLPLQLDTEQEQSNFIVLDVSRPVYRSVEMILRAAWYRNESPWANLYYTKRLCDLGLEYQF